MSVPTRQSPTLAAAGPGARRLDGVTDGRRSRLLLVPLHLVLGPDPSLVGILGRLPQGSPLAEQVPALVQGALHAREARPLLVGRDVPRLVLLPDPVFVIDEPPYPAQDLLVIHTYLPTRVDAAHATLAPCPTAALPPGPERPPAPPRADPRPLPGSTR